MSRVGPPIAFRRKNLEAMPIRWICSLRIWKDATEGHHNVSKQVLFLFAKFSVVVERT
jgi:hypothetical protein